MPIVLFVRILGSDSPCDSGFLEVTGVRVLGKGCLVNAEALVLGRLWWISDLMRRLACKLRDFRVRGNTICDYVTRL